MDVWLGKPLQPWEQTALVQQLLTIEPGAAADVALLAPGAGLPLDLPVHGRIERLHDDSVRWTARVGTASLRIRRRPPS